MPMKSAAIKIVGLLFLTVSVAACQKNELEKQPDTPEINPLVSVSADMTVGAEGCEIGVEVVSNVDLDEALIQIPEYNIVDGEGWITYIGKSTALRSSSNVLYKFRIAPNSLPDSRQASIRFRPSNSDYAKAEKLFKLIQEKSDALPSDDMISNERVMPLSVTANQTSNNERSYNNGPAALLIDGDYSTYYHSPWPNEFGTGTVFPVTWEFEFSGTERISYINIMHRGATASSAGHARGRIGKVNVYWRSAGMSDYARVQAFDLGGNGGYQTLYLDIPLGNVYMMKLEVLDGDFSAGATSQPYIATAEVEFYDSNRGDVNEWIDRVFEDRSCSALKEGVTRDDIIMMNTVAPYLATNVALPLFYNTYDPDEYRFRVHSYEPYSDIHLNRALLTRLYSAMDNPTGIEVTAGEEIYVCLDQVPDGQTVSLAIYGESGEYGPNFGGGGDQEGYDQNVVLRPGINDVKVAASGMAYVMNTVKVSDFRNPETTPVSSFKPAKVHILPGGGKVQGYFDKNLHTDAEYADMLSKCTYKYFMVKGDKVLFLFHTDQLRNDWPESIRSGIDTWDDFNTWQQELMGLDSKSWFNNHIMVVSSTNPSVFLNAANRRVQIAASVIKNVSREIITAGTGQASIWGPSHELGHVNQGAINWKSTTESSNNLFSNYIVFRLGGDNYYTTYWSRGGTIANLADSYAAAKPWMLLGSSSSYQNEDPELHMRMNWQLWNYFHNCGYMEDFFPELFEYLRTNPLPSEMASYVGLTEDAGLSQLKFYEAVCKVSGMDLTEFFDVWGFFRPVNQSYSQYGTVQYTVTDEMISASKARVAAMNLTAGAPIQYLEDRTTHGNKTYSQMGYYTLYKDRAVIGGSPTAIVSGRIAAISGCDNAVAVELRSGAASTGRLLYFANMNNFTIPAGLSFEGNSLWAVQYDGTRIRITY